MRSNTAKPGAAHAGLLVLVLIMAASQSGAQQSDESGDDTPVTATATPQAAAEDKPRETEAPLEAPKGARPTLDYEPSETISEDSSVSFPVDI